MTNDLISRFVLSNEVEKSLYENPHSSGVVRVNHNHEHQHFLSMVANAPAVDAVEVVHAYWKNIDSQFGILTVCSECGFANIEMNYCSQCGAKMDGHEQDVM